MEGRFMSEDQLKELQNKLWVREQELSNLKAQNRSLIERLEKSESIQVGIAQVQATLRGIYQQGQREESSVDQVNEGLIKFEKNFLEQQRRELNQVISGEMSRIRVETVETSQRLVEVQLQSKAIEELVKDNFEQVQEQRHELRTIHLAITSILKQMLKEQKKPAPLPPLINHAVDHAVDNFNVNDDDILKIENELKGDLNTNQDDLHLILQLLRENGETAQRVNKKDRKNEPSSPEVQTVSIQNDL